MGSVPVLAAATKGSVGLTLPFGLGLLAGLVAIVVTTLWTAARGADATSRGDAGSRLRALDDLVAQGLLTPEDYAARQAAILDEIPTSVSAA